jgi:hypothetical protein
VSTKADILWDLLELEAPEKFFVDGKESPAFLLFPKWHFASTKSYCSLYLSRVGLIGRYSSMKKALARLREIVENANFAVKVYQVSKHGRRRGKRRLFAENTVERIDRSQIKAPTRTFNIEEWSGVEVESHG